MKIAFVSWEYFGWGGLFGGFGSLTRILAENMVKRGHEVHALAPLRKDYDMEMEGKINGVKIHSFNPKMKIRWGFKMRNPPKLPDVDVFHYEEPGPWSKFFLELSPDAVHLVTSQDPRTLKELEDTYFPLYPEMRGLKWRLKFIAKEWLCGGFCRRADGVFVQAKYIAEKVKRFYGLDYTPDFLPNPISLPEGGIEKASDPTVLFLGRWDPVKRPDLFVEIAKEMPDVTFFGCGVANPALREYGEPIIAEAKRLPNLAYMGYVRDEVKDGLLRKSWILLNTSGRECLPVSFLDAAAYQMAIVSPNDPDNFASGFGKKICDKELVTEYVDALYELIESGSWREQGLNARRYVEETHELDKVVEQHLDIYRKVLGR